MMTVPKPDSTTVTTTATTTVTTDEFGELFEPDIKDYSLDSLKKCAIKKKLFEQIHPNTIPGSYTVYAEEDDWLLILPGVERKILHRNATQETYLLRLGKKAVLPKHKHIKNEHCMVLEGEMIFNDIHIKRGDFHTIVSGFDHPKGVSPTGALLLINTF